ncbi:hypothetical protein ACR3K2_32730 [Cryptosporidium serpentis]
MVIADLAKLCSPLPILKQSYLYKSDSIPVNSQTYNRISSQSTDSNCNISNSCKTKSLETLAAVAYESLNNTKNIVKSFNYINKVNVYQPFLFNNSYRRTIAIFDLDDTLIPTDWIRNTYANLRYNKSTSHLFNYDISGDSISDCLKQGNIYQYIRMQIDQMANNQLIPSIIKIIRLARKQFVDVAIVTNARSTGWLKVIEMMFPEILLALKDLNIPIIRTNPGSGEPDIEDTENYFNYWMMAKKNEFEKIVNKWSIPKVYSKVKTNSNDISKKKDIDYSIYNKKLDIMSIGDNDFEEFAAIHLATVDKAVNLAKIVRCTSGLPPKDFLYQLYGIESAINVERKGEISHSWVYYTDTVSARTIECIQETPLYPAEDSTEDE